MPRLDHRKLEVLFSPSSGSSSSLQGDEEDAVKRRWRVNMVLGVQMVSQSSKSRFLARGRNTLLVLLCCCCKSVSSAAAWGLSYINLHNRHSVPVCPDAVHFSNTSKQKWCDAACTSTFRLYLWYNTIANLTPQDSFTRINNFGASAAQSRKSANVQRCGSSGTYSSRYSSTYDHIIQYYTILY